MNDLRARILDADDVANSCAATIVAADGLRTLSTSSALGTVADLLARHNEMTQSLIASRANLAALVDVSTVNAMTDAARTMVEAGQAITAPMATELADALRVSTAMAEALEATADALAASLGSSSIRVARFVCGLNRRARRVGRAGRRVVDAIDNAPTYALDRLLDVCTASREVIEMHLDRENDPAVRAVYAALLAVLDELDRVARPGASVHRHVNRQARRAHRFGHDPDAVRLRSTHAPPTRVPCPHHRRHLAAVGTDSEPPATVRAGALSPRTSTPSGGHRLPT